MLLKLIEEFCLFPKRELVGSVISVVCICEEVNKGRDGGADVAETSSTQGRVDENRLIEFSGIAKNTKRS